jgi:hypothetical protein
VVVLVLAPGVFGCGALVGLPLLLTTLVALLARSLGSWVLGLADAAWNKAWLKGVLSSSVRPFVGEV